MGVSQLGYVGIASTNIDAWLETATEILGLEVRADVDSDGTRFLRMDEMHHRFALHSSDRDDVAYAGWQVETEPELERLARIIKDMGLPIKEADADLCAKRRVKRLFQFKDPEGYANELFTHLNADCAPFAPSLPIAGFNTGHLGMGHVVRHCRQYPEMVAFYRGVLGFKVSDCIVWADADATFMRCNPRHHSVALINEALGHEGGQTNHVMVEMKSLDDVGRAYDEVVRRKLPIIMTLGRHSNDLAISFYFVSPSGFGVEVGFGGLEVDDATWSVKTFNDTRLWGHLLPHEREEENLQ